MAGTGVLDDAQSTQKLVVRFTVELYLLLWMPHAAQLLLRTPILGEIGEDGVAAGEFFQLKSIVSLVIRGTHDVGHFGGVGIEAAIAKALLTKHVAAGKTKWAAVFCG